MLIVKEIVLVQKSKRDSKNHILTNSHYFGILNIYSPITCDNVINNFLENMFHYFPSQISTSDLKNKNMRKCTC